MTLNELKTRIDEAMRKADAARRDESWIKLMRALDEAADLTEKIVKMENVK